MNLHRPARFDRPGRLDAIDIVAGDPLVLDAEHTADVERHWAAAIAANPTLWNGSAFLFEGATVRDGVFTATARATDYATLLHALRSGFRGEDVHHVFPVPAVTSADGALLIGRQGATTANAGLAYPPSGSFDADDRVGDRIDPFVNMSRELAEEVGLSIDDFAADPGWLLIPAGPSRIALVKRLRTPLTAAELAAGIAAGDHDDPHGEIERVALVPFEAPLAIEATVPYVPRLLALLAAEDRGETICDFEDLP